MTKERHPNAWLREKYKGSHRKAEFFHCGHKFIMVKEKFDGKPHPKFFAILDIEFEPVAVGSKNNEGRGDHGPQTVEDWRSLFSKHYPETSDGRTAMESEISRIKGEMV